MMTMQEARQKAFKIWVEYDNKSNQCKKAVNKLEFLIHAAFSGIKSRTEKYNIDESDMIVRDWSDWRCEYIDEIVTHARKLGFNNEHYTTKNGIDFDDTKYGLDTFRERWIKRAMNVDGFFARMTDASGVFHRFMLFEQAAVKFRLANK